MCIATAQPSDPSSFRSEIYLALDQHSAPTELANYVGRGDYEHLVPTGPKTFRQLNSRRRVDCVWLIFPVMNPNKTYYQVLGIDTRASADEIKSAYRKLACKYHPDLNPKRPRSAHDRFKQLQEAYDVL